MQETVVKCTSRLVRGLRTLSGQLLNQKHEQRTNLWLIAVKKCLVANFPFKTHILSIQKKAKNHITVDYKSLLNLVKFNI